MLKTKIMFTLTQTRILDFGTLFVVCIKSTTVLPTTVVGDANRYALDPSTIVAQRPIGSIFFSKTMDFALGPFTLVPTAVAPGHCPFSLEQIHDGVSLVIASIRKPVDTKTVSISVVKFSLVFCSINVGHGAIGCFVLAEDALKYPSIRELNGSNALSEIVHKGSLVNISTGISEDSRAVPVPNVPISIVIPATHPSASVVDHFALAVGHLGRSLYGATVDTSGIVGIDEFHFGNLVGFREWFFFLFDTAVVLIVK